MMVENVANRFSSCTKHWNSHINATVTIHPGWARASARVLPGQRALVHGTDHSRTQSLFFSTSTDRVGMMPRSSLKEGNGGEPTQPKTKQTTAHRLTSLVRSTAVSSTHWLHSQTLGQPGAVTLLSITASKCVFFFHEYGRRVGMVPRSSLKGGKNSLMVEKRTRKPNTTQNKQPKAHRPSLHHHAVFPLS